MSFKVIYLTGAPASGKSTLLRCLRKASDQIKVFEYGAELTAHLQNKKNMSHLVQSDVRSLSATLVSPDDIRIVDERLMQFVDEKRTKAHVIIDSHAVTKESYGFRVTPFSLSAIQRLGPDELWVLYAAANITTARIKADPAGRPSITEWEATAHASLQSSVAITYGISLGIPIYFFDSDRDERDLCAMLMRRLQ